MLQPSWSVESIINNITYKDINREIVEKLMKMSALNDTNINFQNSLNTQLSLINSLYEETGESVKDNNTHQNIHQYKRQNTHKNNMLFRLIKSDHRPDEPLTLDIIQDQINQLKPSKQKGEIGFAKGDYFVINGIHKRG